MATWTGISPQDSQQAAAGETEPDGPGLLADPQTLLLVEDDPGDMVLVRELLADSGLDASLSWARSVAEAIEMLGGGPRPGASCWT